LGDFKISSETPNTDKPKPKANKGLVQAYDNLFRVLYHRRWDGYPGITDCQKLVEVADLYCCLSAVVQRVEDALLSTPDISFDLVRQAPYFVDLAAKVRSKRLFHDAFVHLVGNWRSWRQRSRSPIQDEVERLANLEYIRICEMTIEVDRELISMSGSGKRPKWPMVHAVIRRGLKEWLTGRSTSGGKEGVLYKRLLQVSFTSTREDVKNQAAIHSSYSVGDLESALESSTNSIRRIISPLLKNSLVLRNDLNFDHLTCAELKDDEYPWKEIDMW